MKFLIFIFPNVTLSACSCNKIGEEEASANPCVVFNLLFAKASPFVYKDNISGMLAFAFRP
jgi:hypothetical protein